MLERLTPNSVVNSFVAGTIFPKHQIDPEDLRNIGDNLPVNCAYLGIAGTGDYNHKLSSGGSVALKYDCDIVAKVPLGNFPGDSVFKAAGMRKAIDHFSGVSPATMVIVAKAENGEPKPVVLQKHVDGLPLCEAPLSRLMNLDTLRDIRKIVQTMDSWYANNKTYDLCGQKTAKTFLGNLLTFTPFFSDNIMVDKKGHAWLTDNILYPKEGSTRKKRFVGTIKRRLMHLLPSSFIDTLIVCRKTYDFVFGGGGPKNSVLTEASL